MEIAITGSKIIIDDGDFHLFAGHKIWLRHGYPTMTRERSHISIHRIIMGAKRGQLVDHINGNLLDNRRTNLRFCTKTENARNRHGPASHNRSGYRGVSWNPGWSKKNWIAKIVIEKKNLYLGRFASKEEAAAAYDTASLKYFGEYAGKSNLRQVMA